MPFNLRKIVSYFFNGPGFVETDRNQTKQLKSSSSSTDNTATAAAVTTTVGGGGDSCAPSGGDGGGACISRDPSLDFIRRGPAL